MLIIILRAVGSQLRADDPGALKEIILDVQSKSSAQAAVAEVDAMASTSAEASGQSVRVSSFRCLMTQEQQAEGPRPGRPTARSLVCARAEDPGSPRAARARRPKVGWRSLSANSRADV